MRILRGMFGSGPILEVGSGHNPWPQSHVLVDKHLEDVERQGALRTGGRPLIVAGVERLPFRDGAFPYSICAHVLEHVADFGGAVAELTRVSRAGYVETPSALFEFIEPHREYHHWLLSRDGGKLVLRPKPPGERFQHGLLAALTERNLSFQILCATNPRLKKTALEWKGEIPFEIVAGDFHPDEFIPSADQGGLACADALGAWAWGRARRRVAGLLGRFRPRFDLSGLLACPRCLGPVSVLDDRVACAACRGHYPREGERYYLTDDRFVATDD